MVREFLSFAFEVARLRARVDGRDGSRTDRTTGGNEKHTGRRAEANRAARFDLLILRGGSQGARALNPGRLEGLAG